MTCDEFQQVLAERDGGSHDPGQAEHLKTCSRCSDLVADLNAISREAGLLAEDEEPSPRVWNSLEIALRQEGLIRESQPQLLPSRARATGWKPVWLVPLAASFMIVFGLLLYERGGVQPQTAQQPAVTASLQPEVVPAEQDELLKIVEARAPAMRAAYESEFRAVNAYIRDAELSARSNPNDEIAQQYLTNAYEQRAMVYEMAMDHGLP